MMQKLVTGVERPSFDREVNNLLNDGWNVVPGTLAVAVCWDTSTPQCLRERWAVVLSKD